MSAREPDPRSFLPLTPLVAQVLVALADQDRHGYGIIREVEDQTNGVMRLRTGTLYTLLQRLLDQGIVEGAARPARHETDERRRYYRMTVLGRAVLNAETARLRSMIALARAKGVPGRS